MTNPEYETDIDYEVLEGAPPSYRLIDNDIPIRGSDNRNPN